MWRDVFLGQSQGCVVAKQQAFLKRPGTGVGLLNGELSNPYPQPLGQVKGCPPTLEGDDLSWRHAGEDFGI